MAALDRAVALAEVDHVAVCVREHLHLDVSRVLEVSLDVDGRVGEVGLPLPLRRRERLRGFRRRRHHLHALAAAAGSRLDQQRVAELLAQRDDLLGRGDRVGRAGMIGTPAACIACRARVFEPISSIASGGGPIHDEARAFDGARERGVLGEEAVAGMTASAPDRGGGLEQLVDDEVALRGGQPAERERLVRIGDMGRVTVGIRVDGDRRHTELPEGPKDPECDLAPVRNKDFVEHDPYSPDG